MVLEAIFYHIRGHYTEYSFIFTNIYIYIQYCENWAITRFHSFLIYLAVAGFYSIL